MKKMDFARLKEINEENELSKYSNLEVGDNFLYGRSIIDQKGNKVPGDQITYYRVIRKTERGIEYTPVYDYMENDNKGED